MRSGTIDPREIPAACIKYQVIAGLVKDIFHVLFEKYSIVVGRGIPGLYELVLELKSLRKAFSGIPLSESLGPRGGAEVALAAQMNVLNTPEVDSF